MKPEEFGLCLKKLRKDKKLTIRQLDLYSGVSHSYISQLERGARGIPSPDILQKLAKPLGIEYEELMRTAGYINHDNEALSLIDKLIFKISDHPRTLKMMENLNSEYTYNEIVNGMSIEEKLELFFAITDDLDSVHILKNEDGTKNIDFGRKEEVYEIDDENFLKNASLTYKGMELNTDEKKEFIAIVRAILSARLDSKEKN